MVTPRRTKIVVQSKELLTLKTTVQLKTQLKTMIRALNNERNKHAEGSTKDFNRRNAFIGTRELPQLTRNEHFTVYARATASAYKKCYKNKNTKKRTRLHADMSEHSGR